MFLFLVMRANAGVPIQRAVALEKLLAQKAEKWNTSFSVGIYNGTHAWTAVAGLNDRLRRTPMEPNLRFPVGSVTKPYTCALVMQARDKGLIDIDAPISKYVDGILYRENKTSMLELWNGDTNVSKITARRLMGMRAGLHEYNDTWYHEVTLNQPHHDVAWTRHGWPSPGRCGSMPAPGTSCWASPSPPSMGWTPGKTWTR